MVEYKKISRQILETCGPGRLLDVGCGKGDLVRELLKQGADAYGMDVSSVATTHCNHIALERFYTGSILALPFPDETFDTLISTNCLELFSPEDVEKALREMHRVCRRHLFFRVVTSQDKDSPQNRSEEQRSWWENVAFRVGFRKHPAYYTVNSFESLERDDFAISIPLEKITAPALTRYPLEAPSAKRGLHMDMSRETGPRSDARMARYQLAANYIRDGDTVLDAACGMGYGSHLLSRQSSASVVIGSDLDQSEVDYATDNFASKNGRLSFRMADVQRLDFLPDNSVDFFVSFETLEHVPYPPQLIAEAKRVLRPGGRFIVSVPNLWVDETGRDPNPHHLQVYDWDRLYEEMSSSFLVEAAFAQTAGGGMKLSGDPRRMQPLTVTAKQATPAEWWIVVAMKDPLEGSGVAFQETSLTWVDTPPNIAAFARDYVNPWLIKGMISIGWRCTNEEQLERMAAQVNANTSSKVDKGAALCVLAYRILSSPSGLELAAVAALVEEIDCYVQCGNSDHPQELRWIISNLYVKALLLNVTGNRVRALQAFEYCANLDPLIYSPLLATKTVGACWHAGLISFYDQNLDLARANWIKGIELTEKALHGDWREIYGAAEHPFTFGLKEVMEILDLAANCADAIHHTSMHGLANGLPSKNTPARRLDDVEQRLTQCTRELNNLRASPAGRLQHAIERKAPLLRKYLRITYLLSLILLPTSFVRLLDPLKNRFEKHR
jgi:ubiquinone/menaquinone biosynthesis C-methylase UbiE